MEKRILLVERTGPGVDADRPAEGRRLPGRVGARWRGGAGAGIEPADLPHIFEPFYRGSGAVNAQIHGTGLGLSLVKSFIEAQGGRVTVKSAPGEGSSFTLHLPIAPQNGDGAPAPDPA